MCPWVVSVADSDGQVGVRVFPGATFGRSVWQQSRLIDRLRAAKFWAQRYFLRPDGYDRPVLESAEGANVIAVGSAHAKGCLGRFFAYHRRPDLAAKLAVIPYPVDECFLGGEVPQGRQRRLVAVGRWDDPQKDAALLAAAVSRVLKCEKRFVFRPRGPGRGEGFRAAVRQASPGKVPGRPTARRGGRAAERQPFPGDVVALGGRAVVVNEALCMGCTLVGPEGVVGLRSFCQGGDFGTTSQGRSPRGLAAAVLEEMKAWDDGRRDPRRIAATWRPRFEPRTVCRQLLEPAADVNGRPALRETDHV